MVVGSGGLTPLLAQETASVLSLIVSGETSQDQHHLGRKTYSMASRLHDAMSLNESVDVHVSERVSAPVASSSIALRHRILAA